MKSKEVIKMLEKDGWSHVRTKGSHHHFKHPTKMGVVTVPHPQKEKEKEKEIAIGTLKNIMKVAGI